MKKKMQVEEVITGRCLTRLQRGRIRFYWTISDFPFVQTSTLNSSVFPESGPDIVGRWRLCLTPAYRCDSVYDISLQQVGTTNIKAKVKISLINSAGFLPKSEMRPGYEFTANGGSLQLSKFVQYDNGREESKGVLVKDKITIACEISAYSWCEDHTEELVPVEGPLSEIVEDMGNLLSSESLTDVTIEAGGRQFKAHKAILAARSPVFAAMFRNEMVENKMAVVTITDIDPDVFGQVLEHIYTGKEISNTESLSELLAAAEKYNLKGLERKCERKLCEKLSVENVLENLALADLHNAVDLKRKALWLLANNRYQVMDSSSWDEFASSHQHLLKEICESI